MGLSEEIRQRLINSFKVEQAEHVQKITDGLLALESNPAAAQRQSLLNEIFRDAHSLKGSARAVGMVTVAALGHGLESLLLSAREGRLDFTPELFDLFYQTLDAVEVVISEVEKGNATPPAKVLILLAQLEEAAAAVAKEPEEAPSSPAAGAAPMARPAATVSDASVQENVKAAPAATTPTHASGEETIRVSISKLDTLMSQLSELLAAKTRTDQRLAEIRALRDFAASWNKQWDEMRTSHALTNLKVEDGHQVETTAISEFALTNQSLLRALASGTNDITRRFTNDNMHLSLIIDEFQEQIKRIRMLPISTITVSFNRMIRDLARQQGKQINLSVVGGETELDKRILEQIKDPLIHLLRNAADHGIEPAAARKEKGKDPTGTITLSAHQQGSSIVIQIRDDGNGLDLDAIRQAAVKKQVLSAREAKERSDAEIKSLIFHSGLSTRDSVTDISGRGVGLDVVRTNIEELQGTLAVESEPGKGTSFTLTMPLTLATTRGLLVSAGQQNFALPLNTVVRMLRIKHSEIATLEDKKAFTYQGKPIALAWLEDLLHLPATSDRNGEEGLVVVIVTAADLQLGIVVDSLDGEQELVVKNMGNQLARVGGIAGATILGSGEVLLMLHTADLIKLADRADLHARGPAASKAQEPSRRKTILVVDDSITTRTLEKNILEAAGYEVELATDGEEALGQLMSGSSPDLIVSDINMPNLDGFDMTAQIKQDAHLRDIPIVLVTSLDSPADKARGIEAGADAYIVKGSFDQGDLLETIQNLI